MLTDYFIYLHFPRTGGTSLRRFLPDIPGAHLYTAMAHAPYDYDAAHCALYNIPVPPSFIFVRNVWEWYVSQWRWQIHTDKQMENKSFREWMEIVKKYAERGTESLPRETIVDCCPMSYIWNYMQADKVDYFGFYEFYENEVVRILLTILPPGLITEEWIRDKMASAGRQAQTSGPCATYQDCYDDKTRAWVAEWDKDLIDRFGYSFD